ncbi:unnamed protein product [Rotaria sp. Silwood2]|nr:unnamed protein product [Rotaria sp. Silwood2]CAF3156890.1 unnamed protein product [Rotaria sp. Silwood2]CAF4406508.1 unnamed protein product [Rotaria sp. Silwood2]CAF4454421.1 unnamed protein product [Rotaria sp. Silwood2]
MSKRKKNDPNPEDEDDNDSQDKQQRHVEPQKVYDFHKKTIEIYPERLRELNRQFLSSISTQITSEPYSVLVGNCLDYVRQYFNYEDDLLKYSPWLVTRLKQSRSDIVKCLPETIDIYEALARHDFDRIFDKNNIDTSSSIRSSDDSITDKTNISGQLTTPLVQLRPPPPSTISSSTPLFSFTKPPPPPPTTTTTTPPVSESTPSTGFNFKLATTPEKITNTSPFSFTLPNTGFGTSTFSSTNFGIPTSTEKSTTALAPSISFTPPSKISFAPTLPTNKEQQPTATEDNEDEPSEPPEPEKVEHEADAKLTYRCRMGVNKSGKLIKRGPVQVVLKEINDKRQLIVRSDDALGRLYLNILWSKLIEIKKNSTKDLTFICKLNPGMTEVKEGEFVTILFRFDNEMERNDAYEKLGKERT